MSITPRRILLALLAFDGLVLAVLLVGAALEPRSDPMGEGLKKAYLVFLALPLVVGGVLALVPLAPVRWAAIVVASALPLGLVYLGVANALAPIGERRKASGAAEFPRSPAREVAAAIAARDTAALRAVVSARRPDLDAAGRSGRTLLLFAVERAPTLVPLLVASGADPNRRAADGELPLEAALLPTEPALVPGADLAAMRALLAAGARVDDTTRFGVGLLEYAVRNRRPDQAALLLAHGADPRALGDRGWTLPMHAVAGRQWALAGELLRRGASATHEAPYGYTLRRLHGEALELVAIGTTPAELADIEAFRAVARAAGVELPPPPAAPPPDR